MSKLYDVVIYELESGKVEAVIGSGMPSIVDGECSERRSAEMRVQTGQSRINEHYGCKMVEAGKFTEGSVLPS